VGAAGEFLRLRVVDEELDELTAGIDGGGELLRALPRFLDFFHHLPALRPQEGTGQGDELRLGVTHGAAAPPRFLRGGNVAFLGQGGQRRLHVRHPQCPLEDAGHRRLAIDQDQHPPQRVGEAMAATFEFLLALGGAHENQPGVHGEFHFKPTVLRSRYG
jgi:hypothetical protein